METLSHKGHEGALEKAKATSVRNKADPVRRTVVSS